MAGPIPDCRLELSRTAPEAPPGTRVRFALAGEHDDAAIRRLLRASPMRGQISLTFEREPGYFRGCGLADAVEQTVVAFENDRLVCLGRSSVRERFLNGHPRRVGYLGELRLAATARGRFDILRRGYQFFRDLPKVNPPELWFTSIAQDNHPSLRFLERNLRGMPRYEFLSGFVTLLVAVPRRARVAERRASRAQASLRAGGVRAETGSLALASSLAQLLNEHGQRFQFATVWSAARLQALAQWGLPLSDWQCLFRGRELLACASLWDQRPFRQTVIRGFGRRLAAVRPFVNLAASALGVAGIPPVGSTLAHGFVSPLAVASGQDELLPELVEWSLRAAQRRRLDFLTLGFPESDPALEILRRRFRCRGYHSRIYRVTWAQPGGESGLDGRPIAPEVALL